jgi:D-beta-D-heptose 7-phosphate kinase/D-beta-D-heptose 1-phosphate adenosyltransferase
MARVWINGTFDVLHRGHLELLNYSSKYGSVRVGIDSDRRVKDFKGDLRPINSLEERILMMENLRCVDSVVSFDSDEELENQIRLWNPHYLIIGSDYKVKKVIGSQLVEKVIFFDRIEGYSSTEKIFKMNGQTS